MFPLYPSIVQQPINVLMFVVFFIVIVVTIVGTANDVVCQKCCGIPMVSIQFSYMSPSMCKSSSPFKNLVSCSFLTFYLYSFSRLSCGDVICGTSVICLATYTIGGITCTNVDNVNGATLPFIIFYVHAYMLSCSFLTSDLEAPPSSILFFLLRTLF